MNYQASATDRPSVIWYDPYVLKRILEWQGNELMLSGHVFQFPGFDQYNQLVEINKIFSSFPVGQPYDRTGQVQSPLNLYHRPWQSPTDHISLDLALEKRVQQLLSSGQRVNLMWSGGIDSTTVVTAFLKHTNNLQQIRVLYTPFSTYEHPQYLEFLKQWPVESIDISGDTYLNTCFDGIFVTGDGGDEFTGSIDESFFERYGPGVLTMPWTDFFQQQNNNSSFLEFCEQYFSISALPINTVLQARWWFYAICKNTVQLFAKLPLFASYKNFGADRLFGFFDCESFEQYIFWNQDTVINDTYRSWKQQFKNYCFELDGFEDWKNNYQKINSKQVMHYSRKQKVLSDTRALFVLDTGERITTPSLPFVVRSEFDAIPQEKLKCIFNDLL